MSRGVAYVLDEDGTFEQRCNRAMVELQEMPEWIEGEMHGDLADMTQFDGPRLHILITRHAVTPAPGAPPKSSPTGGTSCPNSAR